MPVRDNPIEMLVSGPGEEAYLQLIIHLVSALVSAHGLHRLGR